MYQKVDLIKILMMYITSIATFIFLFLLTLRNDDVRKSKEKIQFKRQDFVVSDSPAVLHRTPTVTSKKSFSPPLSKFNSNWLSPKPKSFPFVPPVPPR